MANLKAGTLIGGNMIWHAGNVPFDYANGTLYIKGKKIYSELDKPTPAEVGAVNKAGDTMTGLLTLQKGMTVTGQINNALFTGSNKQLLNGGETQVYLGNRDSVTELHLQTNNGQAFVNSGSNNYRIYHQGFKPTYSDTGSAPAGYGLGESQGPRVVDKDLNQTVKSGFYGIYGDDINTPYTTGPSGSRLIVTAWSTQHVTQTFHRVSTGEMWTRTSKPVDGATVWEAWAKVYDTLRKPQPSEIGAVNKAGDTMTGALIIDHGDIRHRMVHSGQTVAFYQGGHETDDTIQNLAFSGYNGKSLTAYRIYMKDGVSPLVRWGSTDHKIYHAGNKPTATDVGAVPITGGTATGRITAAGFTSSTAGNAFSTAKTSDGSYGSVSAESSYVMLWKRNDSSTLADEFIGIQGSKLIFRKDNGTGDRKYTDHSVFHAGIDAKMGNDKALIFPTATYAAGAKIYAKDKNQYGADLVIQSGGCTIIGAGESPEALINALPSGDEVMYITSDNAITFYSGANTWADRKTTTIDTSGRLTVPHSFVVSHTNKQMTMGIGTSDSWLLNSASGKYLQMRDNGNLDYGSKMVFVDGDSRINGSMISRPMTLGKEDLDTIKTAGVYAQNANANASAELHYPESLAGTLTVTVAAGPQQRYHVYNSSRIWTRAQYSNGGWTAWAREYNTLNKPSAADVGAVPATDVNTSGTWASIINKIPKHTSNGILEVGKYIDMHDTNSTADYNVRLNANASHLDITTPNGTISIGAQNANYAHIYTDRSEIYTNATMNVPRLKIREGFDFGGDITTAGNVTGGALGVSNNSSSTGKGISLYSGSNAGAPSYGLMFAGTATFGQHGRVAGDWATYFTMSGATNRGWIFKSGNAAGGNVASISAAGDIYANGLIMGGNLQANNTGNPLVELHSPGKHAAMMWLDSANATINIGRSNGSSAESRRMAHWYLTDSSMNQYGAIRIPSASTAWGGQSAAGGIIPLNDAVNLNVGEWHPLVTSPSYRHPSQGYATRWQIGHYRTADNRNGDFVINMTGDGYLRNNQRFHFTDLGELVNAGTHDGRTWSAGPDGFWCSRVGNIIDWTVGSFQTKFAWQGIGTYAMLMKSDAGGPIGPGGTCGGHQLNYCPAEGRYAYGNPPGTWQCLGQSQGDGSFGSWNVTIWVRIA